MRYILNEFSAIHSQVGDGSRRPSSDHLPHFMALNLEALKHAKLKHVKDDDKHDGSSGLVEQEMDGTEAVGHLSSDPRLEMIVILV